MEEKMLNPTAERGRAPVTLINFTNANEAHLDDKRKMSRTYPKYTITKINSDEEEEDYSPRVHEIFGQVIHKSKSQWIKMLKTNNQNINVTWRMRYG